MANLEIWGQEYHCENCYFFDDDPVPSECRKGNGQVAYLHRVCESFQLRSEVKEGLSLKQEG